MAYNRNNHRKRISRIIEVYQAHKEPDIPDTFIVKHVFPRHHIFISLRAWVNIKGMKPSEAMPLSTDKAQLQLFA